MNKPKISVVIPLYNKRSHIIACIESVLAQNYSAKEIIIIDDGSTDGGAELLKAHDFQTSCKIRLYQQANQGVSVARNNGVKLAKTPYVAFLDADDIWLPFFLEEMVNLINRYPQVGFYASRYQCVAGSGDYRDANINMALVEDNGFNPYGMLLSNYFDIAAQGDLPFMISSCVIHKSLFAAVGGFPPGEAIGEDQDLFAKIALQQPIAYSPNINLLYSIEAENKATQSNVPEAECPFSQRLNEPKLLVNHRRTKAILKYCAAHLCHLAKLNIKRGKIKQAKQLLADPRCELKPKHRAGLYLWALLVQATHWFKAVFAVKHSTK